MLNRIDICFSEIFVELTLLPIQFELQMKLAASGRGDIRRGAERIGGEERKEGRIRGGREYTKIQPLRRAPFSGKRPKRPDFDDFGQKRRGEKKGRKGGDREARKNGGHYADSGGVSRFCQASEKWRLS